MDIPFVPGLPAPTSGPLTRFLPPLADGVAADYIARHTSPGELVLDPFGASPLVALEAALSGRSVLVTAHNPVARFVLQLAASSPEPAALRAVLSRLADQVKDGQRLETHLRDLYRSECNECGHAVEADAFVWARDGADPLSKLYYCDTCGKSYERPATDMDAERARRFQRKGLQHATALERVAGRNDPDRAHAEEALEAYPARAIYALMTLLAKLDAATRPVERPLAEALMLAAFDAGDGLRGHPETRARPRQLTLPQRYLELNLWRALERAPADWSRDHSPTASMAWTGSEPIPPGVIAIFEGPIRELAPRLARPNAPRVALTLSVLPRPNQAYWTLSAVWAGWLWGKDAAAFRAVLRRRRYDWAWHAEALEAAAQALAAFLPTGATVIGLMPEAEPGFLAAAIVGLDRAGFRLNGRALRADTGEAQLEWTRQSRAAAPLSPSEFSRLVRDASTDSARDTLHRRGEPSAWEILHFAAWAEWVRRIPSACMPVASDSNPIATANAEIESAIADGRGFVRYGIGNRPSSPEVGSWWLDAEAVLDDHTPLADRVEAEVLQLLSGADRVSEVDLDRTICGRLPGVLTPDARLVRECLRSYGTETGRAGAGPPEGNREWQLREEDYSSARARELDSIRSALAGLGARLGHEIDETASLDWIRGEGTAYRFFLFTSASFGRVLLNPDYDSTNSIIVLPGGRASLVEYKLKRDPRLRSAFELGWRFLKFRHVRWLASDPLLTREGFAAKLGLDPLGASEAQMPLL